jgi:hypothetical protein
MAHPTRSGSGAAQPFDFAQGKPLAFRKKAHLSPEGMGITHGGRLAPLHAKWSARPSFLSKCELRFP